MRVVPMTCRRTRDILALGGGARAVQSIACERTSSVPAANKDRRPRTATARARRDVDDQHDAPPRPGKAPRTTATTQHDAPSTARVTCDTPRRTPVHVAHFTGTATTATTQHTPRRRRRRRLNITQRTQRRQGVKTTHRRDDGDDPTLLRSTKQLPWSHYIR